MGSITLDDITNVMHGNDKKILSVDHYSLVIWQALDNNSLTECSHIFLRGLIWDSRIL